MKVEANLGKVLLKYVTVIYIYLIQTNLVYGVWLPGLAY